MTATARTKRYGIPTMLPTIWSVRCVGNVEAFCQEIVEATTQAAGMPRLEPCDVAEAISFLLGQVHVLDLQFDRELERKPYLRFDLWLRTALRCDLVDFWRSPAGFGRHGQHRTLPTAEQGLDDAAAQHGEWDDVDAAGARDDRLDPATSVDAADRVDADRWLYPEGDRPGVEPLRGSRGDTGQVAAGRDRGAGLGASGPVGATVAAACFVDCGCGWRSYRQAPNGVSRWHWPDRCLGCGRALLELVATVVGGAERQAYGDGLEERAA